MKLTPKWWLNKDLMNEYARIHYYGRKNFPKPDACFKCQKKTRLVLSNKTGIYDLNPKNWWYLCHKCHFAFDKIDERVKSTQFVKGMAPWNKGTKGIMKPNSGSFKKGHVTWCTGLKWKRKLKTI